MTRIRIDGKPMRGDPLYGYDKYLLAERNVTDGKRGWTTVRIYLVPEDVAAEMIAKGAKRDSAR